jgi:hypothetical protein
MNLPSLELVPGEPPGIAGSPHESILERFTDHHQSSTSTAKTMNRDPAEFDDQVDFREPNPDDFPL